MAKQSQTEPNSPSQLGLNCHTRSTPFTPALTTAESNSIAQLHAPYFRYHIAVTIPPKNGTPQPVIAAPMLDDLTITYSLGRQWLEWR